LPVRRSGSRKPCLAPPGRGILHGWSGIRRARAARPAGPARTPWPPTG
jgi:hypothetical protein